MSNLADISHLTLPQSQLSVRSYFDETLLALEQKKLFQQGPAYIGHQLHVPELGDYTSLSWEDHARVLVRNGHQPNDIALLSNICKHRQAIMLKGRGNTQNIVCPLHRWTYQLQGELLGAPHFTEKPCVHLKNTPLQNWNGLLFEDNGFNIAQTTADLQNSAISPYLDFSGFILDHVQVNTLEYNWKTFIEVYLEDYHVEAFHPGLGNFVSCSDLQWHFGKHHSVQTVGIRNALKRAGSTTYQKWHESVLQFYGEKPLPPYGAVWLTLYPNIMIEWYPHVLVISTLWPIAAQKTLNVIEFYYPEEIIHFEREFVESERAAYFETAVEDDEIALRMDAGRKILAQRGEEDFGPYQSPMEDGMQHFHEWYHQAMQTTESST